MQLFSRKYFRISREASASQMHARVARRSFSEGGALLACRYYTEFTEEEDRGAQRIIAL